MSQAKEAGRIWTFDEVRRFGFIKRDIGGQNLFFHESDLTLSARGEDGRAALGHGDRVVYQRVKTERGWRAVEVELEAF